MNVSPFCQRFSVAILFGCAMSFGLHAQQAPITGQMGAPTASAGNAAIQPTPPAAAPVQAPPVADSTETATSIGSVTKQLFAMQSRGTNNGRALPIPGPEASASYQRYLKSFTHPIPEFYEANVSKNSGGLGNSGSSGTP